MKLVQSCSKEVQKSVAEMKLEEEKSKKMLSAELEKSDKEFSELQITIEAEKQRIHKRVTDQVKQIYQ